MSHFYEALRRAKQERNAGSEPQHALLSEAAGPVPLTGSATDLVDRTTQQAALHTWTPAFQSMPCLSGSGPVVEQFRSLRSRLIQARHESGLKTLLVSSGMPGEGKSFIALNLAVSLIRRRVNRVLLIDGDLRRPSLHRLLGAPNSVGLSDYLAGTAELSEVMQQNAPHGATAGNLDSQLANLTFISAGQCRDGAAAELAANGSLKTLIDSVAQSFDWILIDSSPVLAVTDAVDMARSADAVLLAARFGHTPFDVLQRAQAAFRQSRILGVVLNAAKGHDQQHYYDYYGVDDNAGESTQKEKEGKQ